MLGRQAPLADLEAWLQFAPWRSEEALERYKQAVLDGRVERSTGDPFMEFSAHTGPFDPSKGDLRGALGVLMPGLTDWVLDQTLQVMQGKRRWEDDYGTQA
jgi:hypothetical protein